jgi:two-component system OmpR family sensor kinase
MDPDTEVGQVGEAFNAMLGHVEQSLTDRHESEQQLRQFLADASHELRTPLTTIQGYAELTRRKDMATQESLERAMGKVQIESNRMAALVEDMLLLARLDAGRPLESAPLDLSHLVLEAVNDARVVDDERRYLVALPDAPVAVLADEHRLHQVVSNLLNNARRHTPPGTTVSVAARPNQGAVELTVHDDGPGLPAGLQGREFERFTRGDTSRSRPDLSESGAGGAGLGLSIVQAIVRAHGGQVSVVSRPGETTFTVVLPAAR